MIQKKLPFSAVILTKDEEGNIESCLRSISELAREIFIVDSGSSDMTIKIAEKYTDKIFYNPFENYASQRNWAQTNLPFTQNWIFHIDADEKVSEVLAEKLKEFFSKEEGINAFAGILVRRRIEFLGKHIKHGGIYPTYHCRIMNRNKGRCEQREYDQHFITEGPTVTIEADLIENTASSLKAWTTKHNRWADMEANQLLHNYEKNGDDLIKSKLLGSPIERRRWFKSYYEKSPIFLRAFIYFMIRYFLQGGFLDGGPGLIYHFLHGCWFRFYIDACYYEKKYYYKKIK
jgi:glycosyltransferase involved in cell wall biosynthesis